MNRPAKVTDAGDSRRYRTEIPNVIFTLGLSPFELTLYIHLKRTAGEQGECWKSTTTLAKETGMSSGMVSKAKDSLAAGRAELGGKALIHVREEGNPHGGKARHLITLTDVWPDNIRRFSSSQDELASSQDEVASSPHELASSPGEIKKEHIKKEPNKKQKALSSSNGSTVVLEVFSYWQQALDKPKALLTSERERAIQARLREGYSPDTIKQAIDGCRASPFHRGQNDRGQPYDDLTLICRSGSKLESFVNLGSVKQERPAVI
jgi:hypothetical protein